MTDTYLTTDELARRIKYDEKWPPIPGHWLRVKSVPTVTTKERENHEQDTSQSFSAVQGQSRH